MRLCDIMVVLMAAATEALALSHATSTFHPAIPSARAVVVGVAPAFQEENEGDMLLVQLRQQISKLRRLRRLAREKATESSSAVSAAFIAEATAYENHLARLEDMQREIVRTAKAGMIKEHRMAERKWRAWRRSGRDTF